MTTRFNRPLTWLYSALRLQDQRVPVQLDVEAVYPVVDALSSGWALGVWSRTAVTMAASQPAYEPEVVTDDDTLTRWLHTFALSRTGGAGTAAVQMYLSGGGGTNIVNILDISAGETVNLADYCGGHPLVIPPRWSLFLSFPATAAGESWSGTLTYLEVPAGFKIL